MFVRMAPEKSKHPFSTLCYSFNCCWLYITQNWQLVSTWVAVETGASRIQSMFFQLHAVSIPRCDILFAVCLWQVIFWYCTCWIYIWTMLQKQVIFWGSAALQRNVHWISTRKCLGKLHLLYFCLDICLSSSRLSCECIKPYFVKAAKIWPTLPS